MRRFFCLLAILILSVASYGQKYGECIVKDGFSIIPTNGRACNLVPFKIGYDMNFRIGFVLNTGGYPVIIEPQFDDMKFNEYDGLFTVAKNGKWGAVDARVLKQTVECIYDEIYAWKQDENGEYYAKAKLNGRIYKINRKGERLW